MADASALIKAATDHLQAGRTPQALALAQQAVAKDPDGADSNHFYAMMLFHGGQAAPAALHLEKAIVAAPGKAILHRLLGDVRISLREPGKAASAYRRLVELEPEKPGWHNKLGQAALSALDADAADAAYSAALARFPGNAGMTIEYSKFLCMAGRAGEAVALLKKAQAGEPANAVLQSTLCSAMNYWDGAEPAAAFAEFERYGAIVEADAPPPAAFTNSKDPQRKLKIGYISSDFCEHSVSFFIEPVLAHHDKSKHTIYCYAGFQGLGRPDATTARLRSMAGLWRDVTGQPEEAVARAIRADGIDILVELGGLTAGNWTGVLRHRPAPIQATYLGYPNTTGMRSIGHRLVDSITDPEGSRAVESLERIDPCFVCYRPRADAPEPTLPPMIEAGHATFGSFNLLAKTSPASLDLWARILAQVSGSRLFLKSFCFAFEGVRERFFRELESRGVDRARVDLAKASPTSREHLMAYSKLDVALDTTPYNGTTTTCEALWMGVPVITLTGSVHASRVGSSLLSAAGLPELVATTPEAYIAKAVELANDMPRLRSLRRVSRTKLQESALLDGAGFARRLEASYRGLFARWCLG